MSKPVFVISCPIDCYSGYSARSRDIVKALIELHQKPINVEKMSAVQPQTTVDPLDRLEKLARLLEQGILTQEEFDKKKAEILDL